MKNNFDLKNFLVENKMTRLSEEVDKDLEFSISIGDPQWPSYGDLRKGQIVIDVYRARDINIKELEEIVEETYTYPTINAENILEFINDSDVSFPDIAFDRPFLYEGNGVAEKLPGEVDLDDYFFIQVDIPNGASSIYPPNE